MPATTEYPKKLKRAIRALAGYPTPASIEAEAARRFRLGPADRRPVRFVPGGVEASEAARTFDLGGWTFRVAEQRRPEMLLVEPVDVPRWTADCRLPDGTPQYLHVVETADAALARAVLERDAQTAREGARIVGDPYVVGRSTETWSEERDDLIVPAPRPTPQAVRRLERIEAEALRGPWEFGRTHRALTARNVWVCRDADGVQEHAVEFTVRFPLDDEVTAFSVKIGDDRIRRYYADKHGVREAVAALAAEVLRGVPA